MTSATDDPLAPDEEGVSLSRSALKIGKLTTLYTLGTVAPLAIQFLLLPVFTYYLKPTQMGIVSLAARVTAPMAILVQLGLWAALKMQYFRVEKTLRPRLVRTILLGQVVQAVVICSLLSVAGIWLAEVLLPNLVDQKGQPLSRPCVFGLWLMIVWACLGVSLVQLSMGLAQLLERAGISVGISFCRFFLQAGLGVVAVTALRWQGVGRQGTIFLAQLIVAAVCFWIVWRWGSGRFDRALFRSALHTGLTFVPHSFSGLLAVVLNAWLLNKLVDSNALGIYAVAAMFPQLIQMSLVSFGNAAYPTLARLMTDGSREAKRQQSRLYTLLVIVIAGLTLTVALFSPMAITILTESQYHRAAEVVLILTLAWMFQGLYMIVSQPVFFFGGGLWLATATVSSVVVNIILCFVLIPPFGIQGAAWAMVGCFASRVVVAAAASVYLYRLPWHVTAILRILACAGALAILDHWLSPPPHSDGAGAWSIVLQAILFKTLLLAAFVPALWGLRVISTAECRRAKNFVFRRLRAITDRNVQ